MQGSIIRSAVKVNENFCHVLVEHPVHSAHSNRLRACPDRQQRELAAQFERISPLSELRVLMEPPHNTTFPNQLPLPLFRQSITDSQLHDQCRQLGSDDVSEWGRIIVVPPWADVREKMVMAFCMST